MGAHDFSPPVLGSKGFCCIGIKHRYVTVGNTTVWAILGAKHKRMLLPWTTFIWMVRFTLAPDSLQLITHRLQALGITDEADLLELKGSRKKKGKKIDDPDFMVKHGFFG